MNLANISIRRPVFAVMLIAAFMVFGLLSYPKVGVDLNPEIDFPYVTVTVVYPGTDPGTMEREVAEKLEESVNTLGGIRALRSYNLESVTQMVIEFELEVTLVIGDINQARRLRVRGKKIVFFRDGSHCIGRYGLVHDILHGHNIGLTLYMVRGG